MSFPETAVREWLRRACALVDGVTLDCIAITVRESAKSWPEHAQVRVDDRKAEDVCDEVWNHMIDIGANASDEGRSEARVRLRLWRAKAPAGSKTFRTSFAPGGDDRDEGAQGELDDSTMSGALVATNRDLRVLAQGAITALSAQASHGYTLARGALEQNRELWTENAQLRARAANAVEAPDPIMGMAASLLPQLPGMIAGLQAMAAQREAQRAAEAEARRAAQAELEDPE